MAEVTVRWSASPNATGYRVKKSEDNGATWDAGTDVGLVTQYPYPGVAEDKLVLFSIEAYDATRQAWNNWAVVGFDYRNYPLQPPAQARITSP